MAVIASDALGNHVVACSVGLALQHHYPNARVDLWTRGRVAEFANSPSWHRMCNLDTTTPVPVYDTVINLEDSEWARDAVPRLCGAEAVVHGPANTMTGRPFAFGNTWQDRLWQHPQWTRETITQEFPVLKSGYIGEILCCAIGCTASTPRPLLPEETWNHSVPDVIVSASASLHCKLWSTAHWSRLVRDLHSSGLSVGVLGPAVPVGLHGTETESVLVRECGVLDLRGRGTLPQVVNCIRRTSVLVTLDTGLGHVAGAVDTPAVVLYRHGIHRLWTPPWGRIVPVVAQENANVDTVPYEAVWNSVCAVLGL